MKRELGDGLELDDDKARIDRVEVHRFLSEESYWAVGRPREVQDRLIDEASRVVGLYDGDRQIGFCRAFSDGNSFAYLADVYVLAGVPRARARRGARARDDRERAVRRRQMDPAHERHAPALSQVRLRRAESEGDGEAPDEELERQRVAAADPAVAAVEELEVEAVLGKPVREQRVVEREGAEVEEVLVAPARVEPDAA